MKLRYMIVENSKEIAVGQGEALQKVVMGAISNMVYGDPKFLRTTISIERTSIYTYQYTFTCECAVEDSDWSKATGELIRMGCKVREIPRPVGV